MKVSILLPTYNRSVSGYLQKSIKSVISQSFKNWELFVIDDASSDETAEVVSQFNKFDSRIRLFKMEENTGLPALNSLVAFELITGGWIAWQFDDCVWESNHLAHLLNAAEKSPNSGIIYGQARVILKYGSTIIGENFDKLNLNTRNLIPNCAALIKYQVFNEVGWVDPHILLKRNNDHDFWIRASKKFDFTFVEEVLATEYGPSLENSIGNSVSLFPELSKRYMEISRDENLGFLNSDEKSIFESFDWMSDLEKTQLAFITIEHLNRGGNLKNVWKLLFSIFGFDTSLISDVQNVTHAHMEEILLKVFELNRNTIMINNIRLDEQQRYIDEQQRSKS